MTKGETISHLHPKRKPQNQHTFVVDLLHDTSWLHGHVQVRLQRHHVVALAHPPVHLDQLVQLRIVDAQEL